MVTRLIIPFLALSIMAGCSTVPSGTFCSTAKPQRPSSAAIDVMTDAQVRDLLALNEKGRRLCGWKQ